MPIPLSPNPSPLPAKLSLLWVFVTANYLYCDVLSLMDPKFIRDLVQGGPPGMPITESFLFYAALLMEIPIAMILFSRLVDRRFSRWANLGAGLAMPLVQIGSFWFGSGITSYYLFFSAIEIATTSYIAWCAWNWSPKSISPSFSTHPSP